MEPGSDQMKMASNTQKQLLPSTSPGAGRGSISGGGRGQLALGPDCASQPLSQAPLCETWGITSRCQFLHLESWHNISAHRMEWLPWLRERMSEKYSEQ